jgi:Predicted metal-binding integral membrane protein (DUF2182)
VAATLGQWGLERLALLSPMDMTSPSARLGGLLFLAAGLYQLTPLKQACLAVCRSPFDFVVNHWQDGAAGALRMGLSHGLYCLGCCWILMALLFVGGVMNLLWVAVLAAAVLIEKLFPLGFWMARISGLLLAAYGVGLLATSWAGRRRPDSRPRSSLNWDRAQEAGLEEQFRFLCANLCEVSSVESDSRLDREGQSKRHHVSGHAIVVGDAAGEVELSLQRVPPGPQGLRRRQMACEGVWKVARYQSLVRVPDDPDQPGLRHDVGSEVIVKSQGSARTELHDSLVRVLADVEGSAGIGHDAGRTPSNATLSPRRAQFVEHFRLVVAKAGKKLCDLLPGSR